MDEERGQTAMNPLISVIVPVYKVEAYLNQCVESIVAQTYANLEIILVDDGSPDSCPAMCDEWAARDNRIRVIHLENGGAGRARNCALRVAQGEYIAFVDSDDYIAKDTYEYLLGMMEEDSEVSIVECEFVVGTNADVVFPNDGEPSVQVYLAESALQAHIGDKIFCQVIWNKLYKRKVVEGIFFPEGKLIDDEFWTYKVIGNAGKLVHSSRCLYKYRQHDMSVMHKNNSTARVQALEAKAARLHYIQDKFPGVADTAIIDLWMHCLYHGQRVLRELHGEEKRVGWAKVYAYYKEVPSITPCFRMLKTSHKVWAVLSLASFGVACRMRNLLGIGL